MLVRFFWIPIPTLTQRPGAVTHDTTPKTRGSTHDTTQRPGAQPMTLPKVCGHYSLLLVFFLNGQKLRTLPTTHKNSFFFISNSAVIKVENFTYNVCTVQSRLLCENNWGLIWREDFPLVATRHDSLSSHGGFGKKFFFSILISLWPSLMNHDSGVSLGIWLTLKPKKKNIPANSEHDHETPCNTTLISRHQKPVEHHLSSAWGTAS